MASSVAHGSLLAAPSVSLRPGSFATVFLPVAETEVSSLEECWGKLRLLGKPTHLDQLAMKTGPCVLKV